MAELGTLEGLKDKLGVTGDDRDEELTILLAAARRYVLRTTRYATDAGEITAEIHENVREGDALYTDVRPIDTEEALVVEGKILGPDESWSTLVAEVVDATEGRIRIVNSTDAPWPPINIGWSPWGVRRWRRTQVWPLVRLGYSNLEAPAEGIEDLAMVVEVLAAHWDRESSGTGALTGQTAGIVSETYAAGGAGGSVPGSIALLLADFGTPQKARLSR